LGAAKLQREAGVGPQVLFDNGGGEVAAALWLLGDVSAVRVDLDDKVHQGYHIRSPAQE